MPQKPMSRAEALIQESFMSGPPTPAERVLHTRKKTTRKESARLSNIFFGCALRFHGNTWDYALVIHDGMGMVGSERHTDEGDPDVVSHIVKKLKDYCDARGHKIALFAVAGPLDGKFRKREPSLDVNRDAEASFLSRIWFELDAIPFLVPCRDSAFSLEGEAVKAIEIALTTLHPTAAAIVKAKADPKRHEVEVDAGDLIHLYDLEQQAKLTSPFLWNTFAATGDALQRKKIKVSFFSATPQGGGVALMRHALVRNWRMAGIDCKWYVPQGDTMVFDITKRKFHNVLQGVNPEGTYLNDENKKLFEKWTEWNYQQYWKGPDGPIDVDLIVIDDPQLTALIPHIKRDSPNTKIIYRSHIEVRTDLIDNNKSPAVDVWNYLFQFIKQTDLFVAHPVKEFVPKVVRDNMPVVYMPPSTDPLDGLNKPIPEHYLETYRLQFNDLIEASTGQRVDWSRGYILQVARFDPSKGIPFLVEAYRLFREQIKEQGLGRSAPQLILTGHGSVDDPDGTYILHKLQDTLATPEFAEIKNDIYAIRCPPDDRLLDALMRGCDVACQVSTREGFEIKVTEAIHKTRWIIVTKAGGIPLQVRDGIDGRLVEHSSAESIATALMEFYSTGRDLKSTGEINGNDINNPLGGRWSITAPGAKEELFAIGNMTMWHYLFHAVLGLSQEELDGASKPEYKERLAQLGLVGQNDLYAINEKRVWEDILAKDL